MLVKIEKYDRCFIALTNKGFFRRRNFNTWADAWLWFCGGEEKSSRSNIRLIKLNKYVEIEHCNNRCFDNTITVDCDSHRQEKLKELFDNGISKGYYIEVRTESK